MRRRFLKSIRNIAIAALAVPFFGAAVNAESPEEFYKGKTIRVMNSTGAGGTMDLYLLLLMKHMQKHLPEGTELVLEHRTGAGTIVGTNHLYNAAPKDGTYFGMLSPSLALIPIARPEAVRFDPTKFIQIGRLVDLPRVFVARADSGIKTLEDTTKIESTHAILAGGDTLDMMASSLMDTIGSKFKKVPGYTGGGPAFLAMEQGEVQTTSAEPGNLIVNKWNLVEEGKVNVLAQYGLEPVPGLDAPMVTDIVPKDHKLWPVVETVAGTATFGLSVTFPPDVPADRVEYMREIVKKTMTSPELLADAKERKIIVSYMDGPALEEVIRKAGQQPEDIRKWFYDVAQAGGK